MRRGRGDYGNAATWVLGSIATILLIVVIAVAGWQFNWWLAAKNVDKQTGIDNRQKGTQVAWRDEALSSIKDFYLTPSDNTAARGVLRDQACSLGGRLTDTYKDPKIRVFMSEEC